MFADDCKFYSVDKSSLQETLYKIAKFTAERQISLAEEKCLHMTISKSPSSATFTFEEDLIRKVREVKDLGIILTSDLKFDRQAKALKSRGMQRCHQLLKTFNTNNIWTLIIADTEMGRERS